MNIGHREERQEKIKCLFRFKTKHSHFWSPWCPSTRCTPLYDCQFRVMYSQLWATLFNITSQNRALISPTRDFTLRQFKKYCISPSPVDILDTCIFGSIAYLTCLWNWRLSSSTGKAKFDILHLKDFVWWSWTVKVTITIWSLCIVCSTYAPISHRWYKSIKTTR